MRSYFYSLIGLVFLSSSITPAITYAQLPQNPVIFADVPDISIVRVGDSYYMSSTTMHMAPGVPIMKSKDLVNWQIVSYAYDVLDNVEAEVVPLLQKTIYLKAECDFRNKTDIANFFYSLDGKTWKPIGTPLKMEYSMPHFMGYRFGLFNYSAKTPGGYVDFDWFRIG